MIFSALLALGFAAWSCGSEQVRPEPQAEFLPAELSFPTLALGDTARASVTLVSRTFKFLTVTLRPSSDDLSVLRRDSTLTFELDAWEEVPLEVVFHPTTEELPPLRVEIEGIRCAPLAVTGRGKEDPCRSTPERVEFGWVRLGEERTLGFTVHCDGPDSVAGDLQGGGSGFAVVPQGPFRLAPGESLQVSATYHPQERGEHTGTVILGSEWCENVVLAGSSGREWRVRQDGTGDAVTVQAGIDGASSGDVVIVEPGRYYETINLRGKGIHLKSEQGPEVTILDGSRGDSSVVTCNSNEDNRTIIEGFTICNGIGERRALNGRWGGGLLLVPAAPVIRGNIIRDNRAESPPGGNQCWGGGLISYSPVGMLILEGNRIENNFATTNGGGAWVEGRSAVRTNVFRNNSTERGDGGGLYISRTPQSFYYGNTFIGNWAGDHGGAIYVANIGLTAVSPQDIEICQNLLLFNQSRTTVAPDCSGGGIWLFGGAWIHHNTIAFNSSENRNPPAAGGICLVSTPPGTVVEHNLLYKNQEGALVAFKFSGPDARALVRRNLMFGNGEEEIVNRYEPAFILELEDNLFEDPLLCVDGAGTDGSVAENSPALTQPWGVIGALTEPGCGPKTTQLSIPDSWGPITARHGP